MARIPYPDMAQAHANVREAYERLPAKLNIFRMLAHAERNYAGFMQLGGTILGRQKLDARLRELAILHIAQISRARYEWDQHVPIALGTGVTQEQIDALEAGRSDAPCFDKIDGLVLEFTGEVLRDVRASDATLARMGEHFSNQEIVELVLAIGFYMLVARLLETTGVDLEPAAGAEVVKNLEL